MRVCWLGLSATWPKEGEGGLAVWVWAVWLWIQVGGLLHSCREGGRVVWCGLGC